MAQNFFDSGRKLPAIDMAPQMSSTTMSVFRQ